MSSGRLLTRLGRFLALLSALVAVLMPTAEAVNLTTTYTQQFDSMGTSGTAAPAGWTFYSIAGGSGTWTDATGVLAGGFGTPTANATLIPATPPTASSSTQGYNGGLTASSGDRAIVSSPTSVNGCAWQLSVTNTSGGSLSGIYLGYDTRRFTTGSSANELPGYWLFYSLDNGTTWTNVAALNPTIATVPNTTGVTTTAPTLVTFSSALANNATVLLRWVDDNAGQSSPDQIIGLDNVSISTTSPGPVSVSITSPVNGASVGSSFTIDAAASTTSGTISSVAFYDGATHLGTDTTSPYSQTVTGAAAGSHALTAVAVDSNSNSATSWVNTVTVVSGAGTVVREPYLQKAGPTQMTIRWRGSLSAVGRVRYGTSVSNLDQFVDQTPSPAPSPATGFDHIVALTGLTPATTYYYSIGSTTDVLASGADYTFRTSPVPGTATDTRIWVVGDCGRGSQFQRDVRDAYYAWTGARTPDLCLMLGDNAYNTGTDAEYQSNFFNIYPTIFRKMPLWSTLGNHDANGSPTYPYFDMFTFPTAAECGGVASGTEYYYSFDYGNIHFINLDSQISNRNTIEGTGSDGPMAAWLRTDLASTTRPWIIVMFHHPPYSKGSHNSDTESQMVQMRTNFNPIFDAGGVDLVLVGHSHAYERSVLLAGHYGISTTLTNAMKKNAGSGRPAGTGAYIKPLTGSRAHFGAVYAVAGSAGSADGGTLNHPAMYVSYNTGGMLNLDINGNTLNATYVEKGATTGTYTTPDTFTILKQGSADTDNDGIPDPYEDAHGLDRNNPADAALDSDGDGNSNLKEYILSTASEVPDRYAWSTSYNVPPGQATVTFQTTLGRTYQVLYSANLLSWQTASAVVAGTGATMQWIDDGTATLTLPSAAGKRFYRVEVITAP